MELELRSAAFQEGQDIPRRHTADGKNLSPPLRWSNVPDETRELLLMCEDAERLVGAGRTLTNATSDRDFTFVHWIVTGIRPDIDGLPEGLPNVASLIAPSGAKQGLNSFGGIGYSGPDPRDGSGQHRYLFRLFALNRPLLLPAGVTREYCLLAMEGHLINEGLLIGISRRAARSA